MLLAHGGRRVDVGQVKQQAWNYEKKQAGGEKESNIRCVRQGGVRGAKGGIPYPGWPQRTINKEQTGGIGKSSRGARFALGR